MFSYKRFTLNKKLAIIPVVAIVPMIVLAVYLLLTASYTTNAYADITNNVVQANKYVQDFKERVDYTMYLSVIKNKTIDEMQVGKVTVNGILTVNPYQYITELENVCDELGKSATVESNCEQIRRLKNTLGSLRNCVEELEKCINDRNSYDENMQYLDNNIYVLTSLVQSGIENYIYVETTNFENVKAQLNKKNKQDIWIAVITAIIAVAVSTVLSIRAAQSVTGPIKNLCAMTSKVAEGDFTAKSKKVESQDEIAVLVRNFNDMTKEIGSLVDDMKKNHEMLRMIEMKLLQAQINPHFLYNSLSLINWKAIEYEQEDISEITLALSNYYRTSLNKGKNILSFEQELSNMQSYLKIQQIMHDNSFDVVINVSEEVMPCESLNLILQPLVENAIDHGIDLLTDRKGVITVEAKMQTDEEGKKLVCVTVSDNGVGMDKETAQNFLTVQSKGYGARNVNDRIRLYYGESYHLEVQSMPDEGTTITIKFPAKPYNTKN